MTLAEQKSKPPIWVTQVEGLYAGVYTVDGYRIGRIIRCQYDPNEEKVVLLRVAMYGGDQATNGGFNGDERTLDDRKAFIDKPGHASLGILVGKNSIRHADAYVKSVLEGTITVEKPVTVESPKTEQTQHTSAKKRAEPDQMDEKPPSKPVRLPRKPPPETPRATKAPPKVSSEPPEPQKPTRKPRKPPPEPANAALDPEAAADFLMGEDEPEESAFVAGFEEDPERERPLVPADDVDPKQLPPLTSIMTNRKDEQLAKRLAAVVVAHPELLKPAGPPGEPRWNVKCPDGAVLDIAGYGPEQRDSHKPVIATEISVVGYEREGKAGTMGSTMPSALVHDSIRALCRKYETEAPPANVKPLPKLELSDEGEDYFS